MSLLKQANHALRNGQYETAIRLYQQSLQDSPALAHIIQPNLKLAQSRHQKTGTAARQPSLPALPPKSSIDFAAMRVEDIISGAEQAMARDDWHSAYEYWNSLLTRPDEELSPQLLLRTSRELFKLDAFPQAAAALQRAATRNPQDPDVIREQAHQYYYHCYSSWLMLVTENEPDWYKADGLDKRPDWKTACELLEKAEKVSPRHNLRWYVQAYLLLAEDAWDKQNRTQAHAALDTALKAIGPKKLDQILVQAIHTAVEQFRDGQVPENDLYHQALQDQIKALPLELLGVSDWLCLNDILNWNGLLLCGYVAREKAVDLALEQGKKENANKEALKTALKAALDRNDTKLADTYLGKLKRISPDAIDVRELDSCTELMKGNLDGFRQKWPHPPTPAEQRLRDYLKGKTVAVVGPAPTGTLDGEEIDRHDVVVRMNWRGQDSMPDAREFGSKTNISLYNAHTVRLLTADKRLEQTKSLDFRLIRRARHDAHQLQMIGEYPGTFYKSLNAVPAIIINLLLCEINNIKLFKNTLYVGRKTHSNTYRSANSQMPRDRSRVFKTILVNHDLIVQKNFLRILNEKNAIKMDGHISNKLDMEYLKVVNAIHQVKKNIVIFAETPLHFRLAKKLLKNIGCRCTIAILPKMHKELYALIEKDADSIEYSIMSMADNKKEKIDNDLDKWFLNRQFDWFINFNDGTNATKKICQLVSSQKLITIQDGYLGHVKRRDERFSKIHKKNMSSRSLLEMDSLNADTVKIYHDNVYGCKIGHSRKGRYIFTDRDTALKSYFIHQIEPENIHFGKWGVNQFHEKVIQSNGGAKNILYIGQCHSHHGHMGEGEYLKQLEDIFSMNAKIQSELNYRFHPGEPENTRMKILEMAKRYDIAIEYPELSDVNPDRYSLIIVDNSSLAFELAENCSPTVVLEDANPRMMLPKVGSNYLYYLKKNELEKFICLQENGVSLSPTGNNDDCLNMEDMLVSGQTVEEVLIEVMSAE